VRILTILARFGTKRYPRAEQEIDEIFRQQLSSIDRTVVVVDNALSEGFREARGSRSLIGGDNSAREFSAFDRAVEFVGPEIWHFDFVHFATSAFNTLYVRYLERFDAALLGAASGRPLCVGHIDCYNEPVTILGIETQHWIRTCFFFLRPLEVKMLGSLTTLSDRALFFGGSHETPFHSAAPISPRYRDYIMEWLTGGDIGQGVEWHSAISLTAGTLTTFEHKALSIMNEQLLGVRLRAMGCRLADVTWLATVLARGEASHIPWNIGWREQLRGRDHDAVIPSPALPAVVPVSGWEGTAQSPSETMFA
jgi:hypothetical protein